MALLVILIAFHEYFPLTRWFLRHNSGWQQEEDVMVDDVYVHWQPPGSCSMSEWRFGLKVRGMLNLHCCCRTSDYSSPATLKHKACCQHCQGCSYAGVDSRGTDPSGMDNCYDPPTPSSKTSNLEQRLHLSLRRTVKVGIRAGLCVLDEQVSGHTAFLAYSGGDHTDMKRTEFNYDFFFLLWIG